MAISQKCNWKCPVYIWNSIFINILDGWSIYSARTRTPGMLQSMGSKRGRHNWAAELNWFLHNQENAQESPSEMLIVEIPWCSSGWDSVLSPLMVQVWLLVNKLSPQAAKREQKKQNQKLKKRNVDGIHTGQEFTMESRFITYCRWRCELIQSFWQTSDAINKFSKAFENLSFIILTPWRPFWKPITKKWKHWYI